MILNTSILAPLQSRHLAPLKTWLGVDIGRSALKLVEVEQDEDRWKICQMQYSSICDLSLWQNKSLSTSELTRELSQLMELSSGWKHRKAAALLSMSAADLRIMSLPKTARDEFEEVIYDELVKDFQEDVIFDYWETEAELSDSSNDLSSLIVYSHTFNNSSAVGNSLSRVGLNCRILDGLPFALARAVAMAEPHTRHQTMVAFDWGYSTASITFLKSHTPFYTRILRGCQFQRFLEMLSRELDLPEQHCWNLLRTSFSRENRSVDFQSALSKRLQPVIQDYLDLVQKELVRTLQYVEQNSRLPRWEKITVLGGGALFPQVYEPLEKRIELTLKPWSLPLAEELDSSMHRELVPLFGPAAALAALSFRRWR
ncbi:MAG: pilus assembly protein PilM [Planctomycetaceae bacterium]